MVEVIRLSPPYWADGVEAPAAAFRKLPPAFLQLEKIKMVVFFSTNLLDFQFI